MCGLDLSLAAERGSIVAHLPPSFLLRFEPLEERARLAESLRTRVRMDKRVTSVPVLVALAVLADGQKQLVAMETCGSESHEAWKGFLDGLVERGLCAERPTGDGDQQHEQHRHTNATNHGHGRVKRVG